MNAGRASIRRTALIAAATAREVSRHRLLQLWLGVAVALVGTGRLFRELSFGETELTFLRDVGFGALAFFGSALAVVLMVHVYFTELEQRAVHAVLARPVSRTEFLGGKLGGVLAIVTAFGALLTCVVVALVWSRAVELRHAGGGEVAVPWAELFAAGAGQWLRLAIVTAMTLLVCTLVQTPLVAMGVSAGWLIASQLAPVAEAVYAREGGAVARGLTRALSLVVPRLELVAAHATQSGWAFAYGAMYFAGCAALAAWCFRRRDL